MVDPLVPLLADGIIDEIVSRLKSGKEADLWLVRHGGEVVAAKVYKARQARSFHNNAAYKEGRKVRDTRTQRAMDRGSRFGRAAAEDAWKTKEADALHALHAAGVRVPKPVLFYEGVLLMEVVVDDAGRPAPRLVDAHLRRHDAAALYADLRGQVVRMLGCDLIHGDLSPYNVLLGRDGPVVIDFPQVIGAAHNSQAERFFQRDLENLRRFLAALDPALHTAASDGREIWRAYVRRELTPEFVPAPRPSQHRPAASQQHPAASQHHPAASQHHPADHRAGAASPGVDRPARPGKGHVAPQQHPRQQGAPQQPRQHGAPSPQRPRPQGAPQQHPRQPGAPPPHAPQQPHRRRRRRRRRSGRGKISSP